MKTARAPKVQQPKMSELKAQAYLLASQIAGRKIAKTQTIKSWTEGLDLRKKTSWVQAIKVLEEIIAKNVIPMVLAKKPAPVAAA